MQRAVYLLVDGSGSMFGAPMEAVMHAGQKITEALRRTEKAGCETIISVQTYAQQVIRLSGPAVLDGFYFPSQLSTTQAASFTGNALSSLIGELQEASGKGPVYIFLLTDGDVSDPFAMLQAADALKAIPNLKTMVCLTGNGQEAPETSALTQVPLRLDMATLDSFVSIFGGKVMETISIPEPPAATTSTGDLPPPPSEINLFL